MHVLFFTFKYVVSMLPSLVALRISFCFSLNCSRIIFFFPWTCDVQTLAEGAMVGYTPRGMQLAQETLVFSSSNIGYCLCVFHPINSLVSIWWKFQFLIGEIPCKRNLLKPKDGKWSPACCSGREGTWL